MCQLEDVYLDPFTVRTESDDFSTSISDTFKAKHTSGILHPLLHVHLPQVKKEALEAASVGQTPFPGCAQSWRCWRCLLPTVLGAGDEEGQP